MDSRGQGPGRLGAGRSGDARAGVSPMAPADDARRTMLRTAPRAGKRGPAGTIPGMPRPPARNELQRRAEDLRQRIRQADYEYYVLEKVTLYERGV